MRSTQRRYSKREAPDNAFRACEVDRPTGLAITSSGSRPVDLPADSSDQPYSRPPRGYKIVLPKGPWRFTARAPAAIAAADLSDLARAISGELLDQLGD